MSRSYRGTSDEHSFRVSDARDLLHGKFVVVIGDSVMRCVYKDLLLMLTDDRLLDYGELRRRGERRFLSDELVEGGELDQMTNGKNYREVRQFHRPNYLLRFYFITRCYNSYVATVIADLLSSPRPDVIIMNSCLWDITRYGPRGMAMYKENLQLLFDLFKRVLLPESLLIWTTTMPISESVRGGVILDKISFLSSVLRLDVLLANYFASQVATGHGFDVLDLHFVFRRKLNLRLADGIHWNSQGHRIISNMLLRHVSSAWNVVLPLDSKRQPTQLQYPLPTKCTEWVSGARPEGERNRQSTSTGNSGAYSSSAMSNASGSNASSKCATAAGRSVSNVNQKCKGVESRFVRITGFTCPSTPVRAALLPLPVPVLPQNGYQMVGSVMANWPSATVQNCGKAASSATMRNFTLRYKPY